MPFDANTPLVLHEAHSHNEWELRSPLRWTGTFRKHKGEFVVSELPFITDLASVPRSLTWLFPRYGRYTKAAVLHDYLCRHFEQAGFEVFDNGTIRLEDRSDADEVFREVMRELKVPWLRRWLMWAAVTYKTLWASLKVGRKSNPRLTWVGRLVAAAGAAAGLVLLVMAALASTGAGTLGFTVLGLTTVAAGIIGGGHVAQGRWDRWLVHLYVLVMTAGFLPFLAAGVAVGAVLALYWFIEDLLTLFYDIRQRLKGRPARVPAPRPVAAAERAAALRAS